jgi:hypothetical protein
LTFSGSRGGACSATDASADITRSGRQDDDRPDIKAQPLIQRAAAHRNQALTARSLRAVLDRPSVALNP